MSIADKYARGASSVDHSQQLMLSVIPACARVLEFSGGTGSLAEVLRARPGCSVTTIERAPAGGESTHERGERVVVGDPERLKFAEVLGRDRFDAFVFANLLEHLQEPGAVRRRNVRHLRPGSR